MDRVVVAKGFPRHESRFLISTALQLFLPLGGFFHRTPIVGRPRRPGDVLCCKWIEVPYHKILAIAVFNNVDLNFFIHSASRYSAELLIITRKQLAALKHFIFTASKRFDNTCESSTGRTQRISR